MLCTAPPTKNIIVGEVLFFTLLFFIGRRGVRPIVQNVIHSYLVLRDATKKKCNTLKKDPGGHSFI